MAAQGASPLAAIRPYRAGRADEPLDLLVARILKEISWQEETGEIDDIETEEDSDRWIPDPVALAALLEEWRDTSSRAVRGREVETLCDRLLVGIGTEKVVLFAQPIETVTTLRRYLRDRTKSEPALIIGGQDEADRGAQLVPCSAPRRATVSHLLEGRWRRHQPAMRAQVDPRGRPLEPDGARTARWPRPPIRVTRDDHRFDNNRREK